MGQMAFLFSALAVLLDSIASGKKSGKKEHCYFKPATYAQCPEMQIRQLYRTLAPNPMGRGP